MYRPEHQRRSFRDKQPGTELDRNWPGQEQAVGSAAGNCHGAGTSPFIGYQSASQAVWQRNGGEAGTAILFLTELQFIHLLKGIMTLIL